MQNNSLLNNEQYRDISASVTFFAKVTNASAQGFVTHREPKAHPHICFAF